MSVLVIALNAEPHTSRTDPLAFAPTLARKRLALVTSVVAFAPDTALSVIASGFFAPMVVIGSTSIP